jgi:RNA polymerase sigma factor (TIGR02999 family)
MGCESPGFSSLGGFEMDSPQHGSVTQLLEAAGQGDSSAGDQLWKILYDELHRLASRQLANEAPGAMHTTSLVHEAFIKLTDGQPLQFANRRHFFSSAANAMRQIRVDDARRRKRIKRGGGDRPVPLNFEPPANGDDSDEVLAIHELLKRLAEVDPRKAKIVEYRFFAGLSIDETAEVMEISPRTVDSEWQFAKAWLHRELSKESSQED